MRGQLYILIALTLLVSCDSPASGAHPATSAKKTDGVYVESFLRRWLLSGDTAEAKRFLNSDFHLQNDTAQWPPSMRDLPVRERALKFARACFGAPSRCEALASCIRSVERHDANNPAYDLEVLTVTDQMIASNNFLRSFRGRQVVHVSFIVQGCNIGASVLIQAEGVSDARVLSLFYIAG